jgi:hypothetical protein
MRKTHESHTEESARASDEAGTVAEPLPPPPAPEPTVVTREPAPPPQERGNPTVGRIVHYHAGPGMPPEAALIVGLNDNGTVQLVVWNASGTMRGEMLVKHGEAAKMWRWPPRA